MAIAVPPAITCRLIPRYRASPLTLWQRTILLTPPKRGNSNYQRAGHEGRGGRHGDRDARWGDLHRCTVQADLSWSVDVPASALQALGGGELSISASVTNSVGNTGNGTREITIDANLPGLRVDTVAGDDVSTLSSTVQALVITGSSWAGGGQ